MGTGETRYETKTVKTLRGTEGRTADKWQAQGWEVVARSPGKVQTDITLRRPIRSVNPNLYVIGGAVAAVVIAIGVSVSALTHHSTTTAPSASEAHQAATSSSAAPVSSASSPQSSTSAARASTEAQPGPTQPPRRR